MKIIGKKICELASKNKISLERLAYESGISKGYIYDLAKGKANPSVVILHRIASTMDVKMNVFFD